MKNVIAKYWPSIVSVLGLLAGYLTPSVQAYAAGHPATSAVVLGVWMIVLHHLPSPSQQTQQQQIAAGGNTIGKAGG
jgi:hypothetical protein